MEQVGYQLVKTEDNSVIESWGGIYGQCPGVPNPLLLPNGDQVCGASPDTDYSGYMLTAWLMDKPAQPVMDATTFFARVADSEYVAIMNAAQQDVQLARWIEVLRLSGTIDVSSETVQQAKAMLVAAGLLTQERADLVFATA